MNLKDGWYFRASARHLFFKTSCGEIIKVINLRFPPGYKSPHSDLTGFWPTIEELEAGKPIRRNPGTSVDAFFDITSSYLCPVKEDYNSLVWYDTARATQTSSHLTDVELTNDVVESLKEMACKSIEQGYAQAQKIQKTDLPVIRTESAGWVSISFNFDPRDQRLK